MEPIKLNIPQRVGILTLLPEKGNIRIIGSLKKVKRQLRPTEREVVSHKILQNEKGMSWNDSANDYYIDVDIGSLITNEIVTALKKLDSSNELSEIHIDLYDMFIGDKDSTKENTDEGNQGSN